MCKEIIGHYDKIVIQHIEKSNESRRSQSFENHKNGLIKIEIGKKSIKPYFEFELFDCDISFTSNFIHFEGMERIFHWYDSDELVFDEKELKEFFEKYEFSSRNGFEEFFELDWFAKIWNSMLAEPFGFLFDLYVPQRVIAFKSSWFSLKEMRKRKFTLPKSKVLIIDHRK